MFNKKIEWKKLTYNMVLENGKLLVSYNPNTGANEECIRYTKLARKLGKELRDGEETALYDGNEWYILEGDYRKEYEKVFNLGFEACKKIYDKNKEKYRSDWSTDKI